MPLFYFDVRKGGSFAEDPDGIELADLDAAEREAGEAVSELGRDLLPGSGPSSVTVEVRNEHKHIVLIATSSLEIQRVDRDPD